MKLSIVPLLFALVALPALPPLPPPLPFHDRETPEPPHYTGPPKPATIDEFRTAPVVRPLLPEYLIQPNVIRYRQLSIYSTPWEAEPVRFPNAGIIETLILPGVPKRLKWQIKENQSVRVIVSDDGTNFVVHAYVRAFLMQGWTEWAIEVPLPTNAFVRVISP